MEDHGQRKIKTFDASWYGVVRGLEYVYTVWSRLNAVAGSMMSISVVESLSSVRCPFGWLPQLNL
jgi:hypothetical protein